MDKKKTSRAVNILNRRYIKDDKERKKSLESERVNSSPKTSVDYCENLDKKTRKSLPHGF